MSRSAYNAHPSPEPGYQTNNGGTGTISLVAAPRSDLEVMPGEAFVIGGRDLLPVRDPGPLTEGVPDRSGPVEVLRGRHDYAPRARPVGARFTVTSHIGGGTSKAVRPAARRRAPGSPGRNRQGFMIGSRATGIVVQQVDHLIDVQAGVDLRRGLHLAEEAVHLGPSPVICVVDVEVHSEEPLDSSGAAVQSGCVGGLAGQIHGLEPVGEARRRRSAWLPPPPPDPRRLHRQPPSPERCRNAIGPATERTCSMTLHLATGHDLPSSKPTCRLDRYPSSMSPQVERRIVTFSTPRALPSTRCRRSPRSLERAVDVVDVRFQCPLVEQPPLRLQIPARHPGRGRLHRIRVIEVSPARRRPCPELFLRRLASGRSRPRDDHDRECRPRWQRLATRSA